MGGMEVMRCSLVEVRSEVGGHECLVSSLEDTLITPGAGGGGEEC